MTSEYSVVELIQKKRDGDTLSEDEINLFVNQIASPQDRKIPDVQLGAMLMAMRINGLSTGETKALTEAMVKSGDILSWPEEWKRSNQVVDKHSTGGVGDKVSLVLVPALAACGVKVPMVSGRGLGHTGGTLDKMESIPGFQVAQDNASIMAAVKEVGCCIVEQTATLVPADKTMYAIRDVTGTIDCFGLMASSIMSKKIAENLDALILDVKFGKGAFLPDMNTAKKLAELMVPAGTGCKVNTVALLTNIDAPLGKMVGNALEVREALQCLHGDGPDDLVDLVVCLGAQLLLRCRKADSIEKANNLMKNALQGRKGAALKKFCEMLKFQGVEETMADKLCSKDADALDVLPKATYVTELKSPDSGFVHDIDAMQCAVVSSTLGAGRDTVGAPINYAVGLELCTAVGNKIDRGDVWIKVHHNKNLGSNLKEKLMTGLTIRSEPLKDFNLSRIAGIVPGGTW